MGKNFSLFWEIIQDFCEDLFYFQCLDKMSVLLESSIILVPYHDIESLVLKLLSIINYELKIFNSRKAEPFIRSGRKVMGFLI